MTQEDRFFEKVNAIYKQYGHGSYSENYIRMETEKELLWQELVEKAGLDWIMERRDLEIDELEEIEAEKCSLTVEKG